MLTAIEMEDGSLLIWLVRFESRGGGSPVEATRGSEKSSRSWSSGVSPDNEDGGWRMEEH